MEQYKPGFDTDLLLLAWWLHMGEHGEIDTTLDVTCNCLTAFVETFQAPTALFYERDEQGFTGAVWLTPILQGASFSLWLREDKRRSKESLAFIHEAIATALERYPVLLFASKNEGVKSAAERLGFVPLGEVPYLLGDTALIGYATQFTHEAAVNKPAQV